MLCVYRFWRLVFEDGFVNVKGHVQVHEAIDEIPGEHYPNEEGACPVNSDMILLFEGGLLRCRTCVLFVDLIPKSLTTRVKDMGRDLCVHNPGVLVLS